MAKEIQESLLEAGRGSIRRTMKILGPKNIERQIS